MSSHFPGSVLRGDNKVTDDMPQEERLQRATTYWSEDKFLSQFTTHHSPERQDPGNNYLLEPRNAPNGSKTQVHVRRALSSTSNSTAPGIMYQDIARSAELEMESLSHNPPKTTTNAVQSLANPFAPRVTTPARLSYEPGPNAWGNSAPFPENDESSGNMNASTAFLDPNLGPFQTPYPQLAGTFLPSPTFRPSNEFDPSFSNPSTTESSTDEGIEDDNTGDSEDSSEVQVVANTSIPTQRTRAKAQPDWIRKLIDMYYPQKYQDPNFQVVFWAPITPLKTLTDIVKGQWPCYLENHPLPKSAADIPAYMHQISLNKPEFNQIYQLTMANKRTERNQKEAKAQRAFVARAKRDGRKNALQNGVGVRPRRARRT